MNTKSMLFIKDFTYVIFSNLTSLLISSIVVLLIPKLIGVESYGYWQLYIFYSAYVGFLHFGWNDGIYLKYGGLEYEELDRKKFFSQFYMLFFFQLLIAVILALSNEAMDFNDDKKMILNMTIVCMVIVNSRFMLVYILQGTGRIKEYSIVTISERIIYLIIVILLLLGSIRNYSLLIVADLVGKFISLIIAVVLCKEIVLRKFSDFNFNMKEALNNISIGIKLMFANIASMLIIGNIRFGIEQAWDVSTFGKISLTLSVSNLMMVFINAIGLIMFPILRRTNETRLSSIYLVMRDFLMFILLGLLIAYYPIKTILTAWLPQYAESLMYMALLFPIFIYEGKMALLINTYLKTLRKEKMILMINLVTVGLSFIANIVSTIILKNLDLAIISIVFLLAFRSILSEVVLSKILKVNVLKDIVLEFMLTIAFMLSGWILNSWYTMLVYASAYIIYLIIKRKDLLKTKTNFISLIKA